VLGGVKKTVGDSTPQPSSLAIQTLVCFEVLPYYTWALISMKQEGQAELATKYMY